MVTRPTRSTRAISAFILNEHVYAEPGSNPIHSAAGARAFGFGDALVLGQDIYCWSAPPIMDVLGDDWIDSGWAEFRFRRPTYPGDRLEAVVEARGDGSHSLVVAGPDGEPRLVGKVGLGDAPWLPDLTRPTRLVAEPRVEEGRVQLTRENAPVGQDLRAMAIDGSEDTARRVSTERLAAEHPLFTGEHPRIHPGAHINLTPLLKHTYDFAPSMHVSTLVQHCGPARAGQAITMAGRCVETYRRNADDYIVVDGVMLGEEQQEIARIRHTVIFSVGKRQTA